MKNAFKQYTFRCYTFQWFFLSFYATACHKNTAVINAQTPPVVTASITTQATLAPNGVNLQPSYYSGGDVDFGWSLMKQYDKIKTVRIEIEPNQVEHAKRWIKEAVTNGYTVICTYHKASVLGSNNAADLQAAADWWKTNYTALQANGNFIINLMNEWGDHNLSAADYASAYNAAIAIVRTVYNGKIIIDVPGWGQETYVAANAVNGISTGGVKISDTAIVLSAHIYPGGYVQQRTTTSGIATGSGTINSTDLDYLTTANRTCIIGEFGNGTTGTANWSAMVDNARLKGWTVLAWAWAGDGGTMNMISPQFQPYNAAQAYQYTTSSYFTTVYSKL